MGTEPAPDNVPRDGGAEFEALWRRTHPRLLRAVTRTFGPADADEIVQETMLRCYERWDRLDVDRELWPWLSVVARNIGNDRLRERARRAVVESVESLDLSEPDRPDEILCAREEVVAIRTALAALREVDRDVLAQHHLLGLPSAEIARRTGRADNAVRQHLHRARRELAAQFHRLTGTAAAFVPTRHWLRRAMHWCELACQPPAVAAGIALAVTASALGNGGSTADIGSVVATRNSASARPYKATVAPYPARIVPTTMSARSAGVQGSGDPVHHSNRTLRSAALGDAGPAVRIDPSDSATPGHRAICSTGVVHC